MQALGSTQQNSQLSSYQQELLRLNKALKVEVDECHKYIQRLQSDFSNMGARYSSSLQSQNQSTQPQICALRHQMDKLNYKVSQKRHQVKKLQKVIEEMEQALIQISKDKEDLLLTLNNIQSRASENSMEGCSRIGQLETIIAQQRQTIQLYSKELQSKGAVSQKLYIRIEELEREKMPERQQLENLLKANHLLNAEVQIKTKEVQVLRQSNLALNSKVEDLIRQNNLNSQNHFRLVKELEGKHQNEISRIGAELQASKRSQTDLDCSFTSKFSIFSSPQENNCWPVSRRITVDQHVLKQKSQTQKEQLLQNLNSLQQQVRELQDQKANESCQLTKLKNDLVNMKVEYSTVLSKNNQLVEANFKLEKQRNQLNSKLQDMHSSNLMSPINVSSNKKYLNRTNNSVIRTVTSNTTVSQFPSMRMAPNDGEVPVRDKNSIRSSQVCMSYTRGLDSSQQLQLRKSSAVVVTNSISYSSIK